MVLHSLCARLFIRVVLINIQILNFFHSLPLLPRVPKRVRMYFFIIAQVFCVFVLSKFAFALGYLFMDDLSRAISQFYPSASGGMSGVSSIHWDLLGTCLRGDRDSAHINMRLPDWLPNWLVQSVRGNREKQLEFAENTTFHNLNCSWLLHLLFVFHFSPLFFLFIDYYSRELDDMGKTEVG